MAFILIDRQRSRCLQARVPRHPSANALIAILNSKTHIHKIIEISRAKTSNLVLRHEAIENGFDLLQQRPSLVSRSLRAAALVARHHRSALNSISVVLLVQLYGVRQSEWFVAFVAVPFAEVEFQFDHPDVSEFLAKLAIPPRSSVVQAVRAAEDEGLES